MEERYINFVILQQTCLADFAKSQEENDDAYSNSFGHGLK